ncbi:hypothetical protein ABXT06_16020 [Flavobacterium sp. UW10123]|uniref:acyltransferase n=1 Tax=Flavobacterium sp. UW10123 TaxID=3230800 RepID=UPI003398D542
MLSYVKKNIAKYPNFKFFLKSPKNWLYAAYLTLRFVDEYMFFPAFQINGSVRIKVQKERNSKLIIKNRLILERWLNGDGCIALSLQHNSSCTVENDFILGQGTKIYLSKNAKLILHGKHMESGSGITANSVVMVNEHLEIGKDCIIAWDTFITDCDWHGIEGKKATKKTLIGDHTWIGVGAKILKGTIIGKDSIVTSLSVVLAGEYPERALLSGAPAQVLKTNIANWHREMFSTDDV